MNRNFGQGERSDFDTLSFTLFQSHWTWILITSQSKKLAKLTTLDQLTTKLLASLLLGCTQGQTGQVGWLANAEVTGPRGAQGASDP